MTNISLLEQIRTRWQSSGITLRPGVSKADIARFEKQQGVRVPQDLEHYFKTVDGMEDGATDANDIRFWRLQEVQLVSAEIPEADRAQFDGYFVFADYSVWSHGYAIRLSHGANDVAIVGGEQPIVVASSFTEFLELYLREPERLF